MNNFASRNHYLPKFYLKNFCNNDGMIIRSFRNTDDHIIERLFSPKSTGFEWDLYTFSDEALTSRKQRSDLIEDKLFRPIDDHGARALRHVLDTSPSDLSDELRSSFCLFLNSLLERHPQKIRENESLANKCSQQVLDDWYATHGDYLLGGKKITDFVDITMMARNLTRKHMVDSIQDKETIDYLKNMTLLKITAQENNMVRLVTGDNPIVVNMGQEWPIHYFSLSLDPHTLLFGFNFDERPSAETLLQILRTHNLILFGQCEYIYSDHVLRDNKFIKTRKAAQIYLTPVDFKR